jgi:hypothetical protein
MPGRKADAVRLSPSATPDPPLTVFEISPCKVNLYCQQPDRRTRFALRTPLRLWNKHGVPGLVFILTTRGDQLDHYHNMLGFFSFDISVH